ncbi:uncharacterized protein LOC114317028 [Camellia sinensis]|uniref:uncharacterized protein LOC114317028 n=1 Tax=Camellia sinensis TaxID=4442 RepID=UPI0010363159|nr:uncharacterized protein LOC114317028 [Camellia sinensis]
MNRMVDTRANDYSETSNNARNHPRNQHGPVPLGASILNNLGHQILEELGQLRNNRQNERTRLFSEFRKQRPLKLTGVPDPKVAENWLRQIEKMLDTIGITEDADRITLAVFELDDKADHWWELIKNMHDVTNMSWNQFKELFLNKYFPSTVRRERVREFQNLEQGNMTVTQYAAKFEELARYATTYVANDEEKARIFDWGLDLTIRGRVLPQRLHSYADVLETTLESEKEVADARKTWNKRKGGHTSGGGFRANAQALGRQKHWTNKTGSTRQQHQKSEETQNARTSGNQKATGRVFALQEEEADPSVIEGNLVLYNSWMHVLFDTGASHSFISSACSKSLELVCEPLETTLNVMSPMGGCVRIGLICKDCKIRVSNLHLTCDLRVMEMLDFDIILGMDWLSAHQAVIDCRLRKVVAHMLDGTRFQFKGDRQDYMTSTKCKTRWHDQLASKIASLILNEEGQEELELPRVVREYADIFPTELPGLPPTQKVDFSIELQPRTTPISMAPYRMAPV